MTTKPEIDFGEAAVKLGAMRYVEAERFVRQANDALTAAKAALLAAVEQTGISTVEVDGHRVTVTEKIRRVFDAEALASRITAAIFDRVTKRSVNIKAYDAAVELGDIPASLEAEVARQTHYTEVRTTRLD